MGLPGKKDTWGVKASPSVPLTREEGAQSLALHMRQGGDILTRTRGSFMGNQGC